MRFCDLIESNDILSVIESYLLVWERVSLSLVCKHLYALKTDITRGDFEQVKNKYYANLQLLDQYNEWLTLRRMKRSGISVRVPDGVMQFIKMSNLVKKRLWTPRHALAREPVG
jgi:hypothetical protein